MAKSVVPTTFVNGFQQPSEGEPWKTVTDLDDPHAFVTPPSAEILTSPVHNHLGLNVLRTWPTLYDGTNAPTPSIPDRWKPRDNVDVLICGAGPSGLQMAVSLVRQGVSFRIVDSAETPLIAGRADGVQPRFLETLNCWGLASEVAEEGPLIERTAIYKDGKKLLFGRSHQSDSRYRGLHIITQGQLERVYIRDLLRHNTLVERSTTVQDYTTTPGIKYPLSINLHNSRSGKTTTVNAKYLIGSDGASSKIRKGLSIPYDGISTGIYWGIMDCRFDTDYPHAWVFGSVVSSKYGGCVIIPREDGYIRLYTQLDVSMTGSLARSRAEKNESLQESGGNIDTHSITAEEVLQQANRIFAPYKLSFAAPLSWFAVWKISERVARSFSSEDQRVHLVGDAAHVHSVMGAFGLNASIMDAANLAWKVGLCARGLAKPSALLPTYTAERRLQAQRIIRTSGEYLRFVCGSKIPLAAFDDLDKEQEPSQDGDKGAAVGNGYYSNGVKRDSGIGSEASDNDEEKAQPNGDQAETTLGKDTPLSDPAEDLAFLGRFFSTNGHFLLGVDAPFRPSILNRDTDGRPHGDAIAPRNGVRAPNPRVAVSAQRTGYLYDAMTGASVFHVLLFASSLTGATLGAFRRAVAALDGAASFFHRYGAARRFNLVLVFKGLPHEFEARVSAAELRVWRDCGGQVLYDDRAPDEDAHTTYRVDHRRGAAVVVRPDLWVGEARWLAEFEQLEEYFGGFMVDTADALGV